MLEAFSIQFLILKFYNMLEFYLSSIVVVSTSISTASYVQYILVMNYYSTLFYISDRSRVLFPGHGVPSCITHPSSGFFCAAATNALILTLNSSYSLCNYQQKSSHTLKYNKDIRAHNFRYQPCLYMYRIIVIFTRM